MHAPFSYRNAGLFTKKETKNGIGLETGPLSKGFWVSPGTVHPLKYTVR